MIDAKAPVRNGPKSRPSRLVYESKKTQKSQNDYILRELDGGDNLDFILKINDDLTIEILIVNQRNTVINMAGRTALP